MRTIVGHVTGRLIQLPPVCPDCGSDKLKILGTSDYDYLCQVCGFVFNDYPSSTIRRPENRMPRTEGGLLNNG